jgi:hypothetical protein
MAWKWYTITDYKVSVGSEVGNYYGSVQLFGEDIFGLLKFHKDGPLPNASAPTTFGQRFYGHLDFQQMATMVDLLRNENPIRFGWNDNNKNQFILMTGSEAVGEGDGFPADGE